MNVTVFLIAVQLLAPALASAADGKDVTTYTLRQWGVCLGMAVLGGVANWLGQVRRGEVPISSVSTLVGEVFIAAFAGLLAFFICDWMNFPQPLTAAMTGICGHMGGRAVAMFERWAEAKFGSLNTTPSDPPN